MNRAVQKLAEPVAKRPLRLVISQHHHFPTACSGQLQALVWLLQVVGLLLVKMQQQLRRKRCCAAINLTCSACTLDSTVSPLAAKSSTNPSETTLRDRAWHKWPLSDKAAK
jgi:hypothetical protein